MADDRKKVDAYIAKAAPFARPILEKVRAAFHAGCPDIEERLKWGVPSFEKQGLVGGIAAFKAHASFGFWRGAELDDPQGILRAKGTASFMAEKFTDLSQVPPEKILVDYVRRAVALNLAGPAKRAKKPAKPPPKVPADLTKALKTSPNARATFEGLAPSHQREYVEWLTEAKRPETRAKRLATTLEWLAAGKSRNWKYENC